MEEGDTWHGFTGLEDNWVMLDPIKVSILGPGMGDDGNLLDHGVPASLVSYYIYQEGIVPTRTTDFQLMFLFSMGITKGKWGTCGKLSGSLWRNRRPRPFRQDV